MVSFGNSKYSYYIKIMQAPIFRVLKSITLDKKEWKELDEEEKNSFNNWLINRFLSMDPDYVEVVNIVQKNTWQMKGEYLYNLYRDLIPKQYKFLKYIKSSVKSDYSIEEIEAVQQYFEVSKKQAKEYINLLPTEELIEITQKINGK